MSGRYLIPEVIKDKNKNRGKQANYWCPMVLCKAKIRIVEKRKRYPSNGRIWK